MALSIIVKAWKGSKSSSMHFEGFAINLEFLITISFAYLIAISIALLIDLNFA